MAKVGGGSVKSILSSEKVQKQAAVLRSSSYICPKNGGGGGPPTTGGYPPKNGMPCPGGGAWFAAMFGQKVEVSLKGIKCKKEDGREQLTATSSWAKYSSPRRRREAQSRHLIVVQFGVGNGESLAIL